MAIEIGMAELLKKCLFASGRCIRHDVVIFALAAEDYCVTRTLNPLFDKMERLRFGDARKRRPDLVDFDPEWFLGMVRQFEARRWTFPYRTVTLSREGTIRDGAHRLGCCIAFGIDPMAYEQTDGRPDHEDWRWFLKSFTPEEIEEIEREARGIYDRFIG